MAPPTKLRPHLNNLLQKNLELEHIVADLRHQLTQSSAKWAEERKMLAMGCDTLMASFAKFRARLDLHASDWGDSEGEVEQNLDMGGQNDEVGEGDRIAVQETAEGNLDQQSSVIVDGLRERCHALAAQLQVKDEELEDSRKKYATAEEELKRVQQSLETQSEQLRATLASAKADGGNAPESISNDTAVQTSPSQSDSEAIRVDKLNYANLEISRLKKLLLEWQKYAGDWKQDAQIMRGRESEIQRREEELGAQSKTAEENKALLDTEQKQVHRLTILLGDQTELSEERKKRVEELEATVVLLRALLSPEQLAAIDSETEKNQPEPLKSTKSPTPNADANSNRRNDTIILKIPSRSSAKPSKESNGPQEVPKNVSSAPQQVPDNASTSVNSASQASSSIPNFNTVDYELCVHTCNPLPCRNESQSFLWLRKQGSLPRHAVSPKKHRRCTPECPGHRLLMIPMADALKEPRRARCRPPTEAEVALAEEEAKGRQANEQAGEKGAEVEEEPESSREPEEPEGQDEPERREGGEDLELEKRVDEMLRQANASSLGKRVRPRPTDGEDSPRTRKLRPRTSATTKS